MGERAEKTGLRPGTAIEAYGSPAMPGFPAVAPERLTIGRPRKGEKAPTLPGWYIVQFADGGRLCMHETNFRVIGA